MHSLSPNVVKKKRGHAENPFSNRDARLALHSNRLSSFDISYSLCITIFKEPSPGSAPEQGQPKKTGIKKQPSDYIFGKTIGEGSFSTVSNYIPVVALDNYLILHLPWPKSVLFMAQNGWIKSFVT